MAATNHAAFLSEQGARLVVAEAPFPQPGPGQLVLKTAAVAINPIDWMQQDTGMLVQKYPTILGGDAAGTVVSVGDGVSGFAEGDRVVVHCCNLVTGKSEDGTFQEYVSVNLPLAAKIPAAISFEQAVVLPLTFDTAADGLFSPDKLGLALPPARAGEGKAIFVWGGSSSVGVNAIQLARAAGYEVVATGGAHNIATVEALGASRVIDHKSPSVVEDAVAALAGKEVVGGWDTISKEVTVQASCEILDRVGGRKHLTVSVPGSKGFATRGVEISECYAAAMLYSDVSKKLWAWLPHALESGAIQPKPDPVSGGVGLAALQDAMDMQKKGMSAQKVVVTF